MENAVGEFAAIKPVISGNDEPAILPWAMAIWNQSGVIKLVRCGTGRKLLWFQALQFQGGEFFNQSVAGLTGFGIAS